MSDDLVERVALRDRVKSEVKAATRCWGLCVGATPDKFCRCEAAADAAIAVLRPALRAEALEKAAKVADEFESDADPDAGSALAAAIRALIKPAQSF